MTNGMPNASAHALTRTASIPLLAMAGAIACCAHAQPTVRAYLAPEPSALLATLAAHQAAVRGMNASARATSWIDGTRVRATVNMLVERDGHLRFEAEVRLQGMVAALATDGTTFSLYDARKNEVNHGPACPANVASLLRIPLAPADVAALLLGDVRLPDGAQPDKQVSWDAARGADVLVVRTRDGGVLQLMFRGSKEAERALVAVVRSSASGARQWQASFEDVKNAGGVPLPETIRFAEGNASFDDGVEILFKDRKLNTPPAANAFTLATPAGATVREVGCEEP
jgi:outer membrane lipoprotein-sorting protein